MDDGQRLEHPARAIATTVPHTVRAVQRKSAAEMVRDELLRLVKEGVFAVGARIPTELELSRAFGVSRPVIREALGGLRMAGILQSNGGAGTVVVALPAVGLRLEGGYSSAELHEVRRHLEVPGAALAATRRRRDHLARLKEIVDRHANCETVEEWVKDDLAFHVTLAEATGNSLQTRLVAELRELQFEQTVVMAERLGGLAAPEQEHRAILNAIRRRDPKAAQEAMKAHLDAILQRSRDAERTTAPKPGYEIEEDD